MPKGVGITKEWARDLLDFLDGTFIRSDRPTTKLIDNEGRAVALQDTHISVAYRSAFRLRFKSGDHVVVNIPEDEENEENEENEEGEEDEGNKAKKEGTDDASDSDEVAEHWVGGTVVSLMFDESLVQYKVLLDEGKNLVTVGSDKDHSIRGLTQHSHEAEAEEKAEEEEEEEEEAGNSSDNVDQADQDSNRLALRCAKVLAFAQAHPEMLIQHAYSSIFRMPHVPYSPRHSLNMIVRLGLSGMFSWFLRHQHRLLCPIATAEATSVANLRSLGEILHPDSEETKVEIGSHASFFSSDPFIDWIKRQPCQARSCLVDHVKPGGPAIIDRFEEATKSAGDWQPLHPKYIDKVALLSEGVHLSVAIVLRFFRERGEDGELKHDPRRMWKLGDDDYDTSKAKKAKKKKANRERKGIGERKTKRAKKAGRKEGGAEKVEEEDDEEED
jgi:hypothetical protein